MVEAIAAPGLQINKRLSEITQEDLGKIWHRLGYFTDSHSIEGFISIPKLQEGTAVNMISQLIYLELHGLAPPEYGGDGTSYLKFAYLMGFNSEVCYRNFNITNYHSLKTLVAGFKNCRELLDRNNDLEEVFKSINSDNGKWLDEQYVEENNQPEAYKKRRKRPRK